MDQEQQAQICARIKQARTEAGMTLEDMADALGVTQRAYWNYEHNRVPFKRISEIAEITGVTQGWLLHGAPLEREPGLLQDVSDAMVELERGVEAIIRRLDEAHERLGRIEAALLPPGDARHHS